MNHSHQPTTPGAAPVQGEQDITDAERWQWLLDRSQYVHGRAWLGGLTASRQQCDFFSKEEAKAALTEAIDVAIRAARSTGGPKP